MNLIDLNSENFEGKSGFRPFNNGVAGIVEPVTVNTVEKDNEKNRWVVTYQDAQGGTLRDFYNYVDEADPNVSVKLKGQGITLRHLWKELIGNTALPTFQTPVEMLDTIMNALKVHSKNKTFRLVVDYGYADRHNTNLNRKRFVPFLENINVEKSSLFMVKGAYTTPAEPTKLDDFVKPAEKDTSDWLR